MKKKLLIIFASLFSLMNIYGQENAFSSSNVSFANSIKYNKFLISPAFSYVREEAPTISLVNRRPWMKFENAPNQYYLGYLGKINNDSRFGLGIYNESAGVLTNFGAVVNYAYNVYFSEESELTFGLNINYYKSSFNIGKIVTVDSEPLVIATENSSFVGIRPGINLRFSNIDFGISGNNIALYNLNTSETVKNNQEGSFLGYVMYTYDNDISYGSFADSKFSTLLQVEKKKDATGFSGIAMLDLPTTGWAQLGYNSLSGPSAGLGVTISERFSLGYIYQIGLADAMDLGSVHQLTLAYRFKTYEETFNQLTESEKRRIRENASKTSGLPRVSTTQANKDKLAKLAQEKADREKLALLEKERKAQEERDRLAQLAADKAERERLAQLEKDRLAALNNKPDNAQAEADRLAQAEKDRLAKLAADKLAADKAEADRLAQAEKDRLAKLAADKLAADKAEAARLAKLEKDKQNASQAELDRLAKVERDRLAKLAADKLAADKAEAARLAQLEKDRLAKLAADKLAADKAEAARLAQLEKDKQNANQAELDRLAQAEKDRLAKLAADKLAADKAEAARLAQAEKDRLAKLAADKLAADKAEAARLAQLEKDRLAKLAADKAAADKAEAARLAQLEKDRLAKLAADKAAADNAEAARLAQLEKDRLAKLAADKAAADNAEAARLAQLEKDRLAKLAADKAAADKAEAARLAQAEKDRLAKLAADKAEADRLALLNAEKSADQLKKEQQLAFEKAIAQDKLNSTLEAYKKDIAVKTKKSDNVLKSLDSLVKARELDLKDFIADKEPTKFVSTSKANSEVLELKNKVALGKLEYNKLISDFEAANKIRMNELKNKGLSQAEMDQFNDYYNKTLNELKSKRDAFADAERRADLKIVEISKAKEEERLRRIKIADYNSEQQRKLRDQQDLENIKNSTAVTNPNNANNQQGTADPSNSTDIPIVKNSDTDSGYYLVLGTFTSEQARNEFLAKVVGAGGSNVKIFYNLSNLTHYVYIDKFESLSEATNALKQKGTKSYNGKMYIVSVQ